MKRHVGTCPCRVREPASVDYSACCERWHTGILQGRFPLTAQELMRSRYSAYALAQRNDAQGQALLRYLLATWHSGTTPGDLELSPLQWTGLDVLHEESTQEAAVVEFVAWFKENGKAQRLHERSRFVCLNNRWYYLDGLQE
jgi:SEC-C motif domain protein